MTQITPKLKKGCIAKIGDAKFDIGYSLRHHAEAISTIKRVHMRAIGKYKPFSWYNDPEHADGDPVSDINAIARHFTAHRMGFLIDDDGLPHIEHMCCRAAMLINTWYRKSLHLNDTICIDQKELDILKVDISSLLITPFVVYSLSKFAGEDYSSVSKTTMEQYIQYLINLFMVDPEFFDRPIDNEDMLNPAHQFLEDKLFFAIISYYEMR